MEDHEQMAETIAQLVDGMVGPAQDLLASLVVMRSCLRDRQYDDAARMGDEVVAALGRLVSATNEYRGFQ